jgi:hypothetical protein
MVQSSFAADPSNTSSLGNPVIPNGSANAPVTQDQFRAWTDWAKKSVQLLDQRERRVEAEEAALKSNSSNSSASSPGNSSGSQAVDLSTMDAPPGGGSQAAMGSYGGSSSHGPRFEAYFDFNLVNQPGTTDALAFDNYHSYLFVDMAPTPDLTFSFNLLGPSTFPIYYELDYQASSKLTLRAGKIWIPFDDLSPISPHNIFGGRVGIQQLEPTATGFNGQTLLPGIWTELGVGAKYMLLDTKALQLETHFCIVNGFTDGGQDPTNSSSTDYPNFTEYSPLGSSLQGDQSGNHRSKSIALRAHALLANTFGFGISYYTGQWNQDSDAAGHLNLSMIGLDAQMKLWLLQLRAGIMSMSVNLPQSQTTKRGGTYFEAGLPFANNKWKILARAGTLQLDSRIIEPTDQTVLGGTLIYNPAGMIQLSLEHSQDVKNPGVAVGFVSYTDLRMVMVF